MGPSKRVSGLFQLFDTDGNQFLSKKEFFVGLKEFFKVSLLQDEDARIKGAKELRSIVDEFWEQMDLENDEEEHVKRTFFFDFVLKNVEKE